MKQSIIKATSPLEEELQQKRAELAALEDQLTQLELELATLNAELTAFEIHYLKTVGQQLATLDDLEARIAKLMARLFPADEQLEKRADFARQKAEQSKQEANYAHRQPEESARFKPTEEIKSLYREVAKQVHPDLAVDDAERELRSELMKEANQAFQAGDMERLMAIKNNWKDLSDGVSQEELELKRINEKISRVKSRIRTIQEMLAALLESDLYKLMTRVIQAAEEGRDLLQEMADELRVKIELRRLRLTELERASNQ